MMTFVLLQVKMSVLVYILYILNIIFNGALFKVLSIF